MTKISIIDFVRSGLELPHLLKGDTDTPLFETGPSHRGIEEALTSVYNLTLNMTGSVS